MGQRSKIHDWAKSQFTPERMVRWLDGYNPKRSFGGSSFFQIIPWRNLPELWSAVHVTTPDKRRATYYLKGTFMYAQKKDCYAVDLIMRCNERKATTIVFFSAEENAPKKLNKHVRALRKELEI